MAPKKTIKAKLAATKTETKTKTKIKHPIPPAPQRQKYKVVKMASTNGKKKKKKKKTPSPFSANCLKKEIRPAPPQNKMVQISGKIKTEKKKMPAKINVDAAAKEVERGERLSEVYALITPRFLAREIEALIAEEAGHREQDENGATTLTCMPMLMLQENGNEKVEREFKIRGRSRVEFMEAEGKDADADADRDRDRDRRGLRRSKRQKILRVGFVEPPTFNDKKYRQGKGTCSLSPNLTPPSIISNQNPKTLRQFTSHPRPASKPSNIVKSTLLPPPLRTNHLLPHGRTPFSTPLTPRLDMGTIVDGHGNLRNVGSWEDGGEELPDYIDDEDVHERWFHDPPLSKGKPDNGEVSKGMEKERKRKDKTRG